MRAENRVACAFALMGFLTTVSGCAGKLWIDAGGLYGDRTETPRGGSFEGAIGNGVNTAAGDDSEAKMTGAGGVLGTLFESNDGFNWGSRLELLMLKKTSHRFEDGLGDSARYTEAGSPLTFSAVSTIGWRFGILEPHLVLKVSYANFGTPSYDSDFEEFDKSTLGLGIAAGVGATVTLPVAERFQFFATADYCPVGTNIMAKTPGALTELSVVGGIRFGGWRGRIVHRTVQNNYYNPPVGHAGHRTGPDQTSSYDFVPDSASAPAQGQAPAGYSPVGSE